MPRPARTPWMLATLAWGAVVMVGLLWPGHGSLRDPSGVDKLVHLVIFAILGALAVRVAPRGLRGRRDTLAWVLVIGATLGLATELLQGVLDVAVGWGRTAELADGIADVVGAGLGGWLMLRRRPASERESAAP